MRSPDGASAGFDSMIAVERGLLMVKRSILLAMLAAGLLLGTAWWWRSQAHDAPPLSGAVADFNRFDPPRPAPGVDFHDGAGKLLHLADFRGKLVLLNIWATWCAPCRAEMPSLDRLEAALGSQGLVVLPVSLDGGPAVALFYGEHAVTHLGVYLGAQDGLQKAFKFTGVPTSFLIDAKGRMVGSLEGATQWDAPESQALIRFYLDTNPAPASSPTMPAAYHPDQRVGVGFSPL
jgi:thiol-disulfide isomerase/thioredoxin